MGKWKLLTESELESIFTLYRENKSLKYIANTLGLTLTRVNSWTKKFRMWGGPIPPTPSRRGHKKKKKRPEHSIINKMESPRTVAVVRRQLRVNTLLPAGQPKEKKARMSRNVSVRTVHGHIGHNKPLLNLVQRCRRVAFAEQYKEWDISKWKHVLWSGEATFEVTGNTIGSDLNLLTSKQRRNYVVVWGCFSYFGAGDLVILPVNEKLNQDRYLKLLCDHLPGSYEKCNARVFQQDTASWHTAEAVTQWLRGCKVDFIPTWPSNSPDISPMENLWGIIKKRLQGKNIRTVIKLKAAIEKKWHDLEQQLFEKLVLTIPSRLAECIRSKGKIIAYSVDEWPEDKLCKVSAPGEEIEEDSASTSSSEAPLYEWPEDKLCKKVSAPGEEIEEDGASTSSSKAPLYGTTLLLPLLHHSSVFIKPPTIPQKVTPLLLPLHHSSVFIKPPTTPQKDCCNTHFSLVKEVPPDTIQAAIPHLTAAQEVVVMKEELPDTEQAAVPDTRPAQEAGVIKEKPPHTDQEALPHITPVEETDVIKEESPDTEQAAQETGVIKVEPPDAVQAAVSHTPLTPLAQEASVSREELPETVPHVTLAPLGHEAAVSKEGLPDSEQAAILHITLDPLAQEADVSKEGLPDSEQAAILHIALDPLAQEADVSKEGLPDTEQTAIPHITPAQEAAAIKEELPDREQAAVLDTRRAPSLFKEVFVTKEELADTQHPNMGPASPLPKEEISFKEELLVTEHSVMTDARPVSLPSQELLGTLPHVDAVQDNSEVEGLPTLKHVPENIPSLLQYSPPRLMPLKTPHISGQAEAAEAQQHLEKEATQEPLDGDMEEEELENPTTDEENPPADKVILELENAQVYSAIGEEEDDSQVVQGVGRRRYNTVALDVEVEKDLGEWFKAHKFLYDKGQRDHRDVRKKRRVLKKKADSIGLTVEQIWTWFKSMRTRLGRLTKAKSGAPAGRPPTARDRWILATFTWLVPHIDRQPSRALGCRKVSSSAEPTRTPTPEVGSEAVEQDEDKEAVLFVGTKHGATGGTAAQPPPAKVTRQQHAAVTATCAAQSKTNNKTQELIDLMTTPEEEDGHMFIFSGLGHETKMFSEELRNVLYAELRCMAFRYRKWHKEGFVPEFDDMMYGNKLMKDAMQPPPQKSAPTTQAAYQQLPGQAYMAAAAAAYTAPPGGPLPPTTQSVPLAPPQQQPQQSSMVGGQVVGYAAAASPVYPQPPQSHAQSAAWWHHFMTNFGNMPGSPFAEMTPSHHGSQATTPQKGLPTTSTQ